jgi:acetoin utilization deacetylase AcuC-like enzyme
MKIVFDERQLAHDPELYFRRGALIGHPEQPQRAILLRDALLAAGHERAHPADHGLDPIRAVHDPDFVDCLMGAWEALGAELGPDPIVPTFHPQRRDTRLPASMLGRLGWYSTDTSCPIVPGTAQAIYWSAQTAIDAADRVASGAESHAYALCRPPGHHATHDQTMGFCFFNNAAIAAQRLRGTFSKVAILDVDTHGGNGTEDVFYGRGDVFFVSIHTDPSAYTPFFTGYADETGAGDGVGATRNLVLPVGASVEDILARYDEALDLIGGFGAEALVISLGLDMSKDDPLSLVGMTGEGFAEGARRIARLGLPTVLVQEGGYLGPSLSDNAVAFLGAFDEARHA